LRPAGYPAALLPALCPEGKGKLERWHRTFRDQFLSELEVSRSHDLDDLNARLWPGLSRSITVPHGDLDDKTPLARFQQDLSKIRQLGQKTAQLDAIFIIGAA